jgi:two-component system OmpR family response regulator
MPVKVLLLEDDAATCEHVVRSLTQAGHVVDACSVGRDAIFHATGETYGVLIIDRMVPTIDGLSVVKAVRAAGVSTPVIFLTAMDGVDDRVEGLEAGGDDYLVKPFAMTELLARVSALGRRPPLGEDLTMLRVADLELDRLKRSATRAGQFKLLEDLMQHAGEIVTRTMLLENVWSFHFDPRTNVIESHMSRLRSKVDRGFASELIHTVRGSGYRIDAGG